VVIDDSETVCRILEAVLAREGHQVKSFLDPVLAFRSINKGETPLPDLLFVDIHLPRLDGYKVIQHFKKQPAFMHIPIIVISRSDGVIDRLKAQLAGSNAYLAKPFQAQDVIALVQGFATLPNANTPENN
jgi:twitching motility two-component system response regulator PilG